MTVAPNLSVQHCREVGRTIKGRFGYVEVIDIQPEVVVPHGQWLSSKRHFVYGNIFSFINIVA